MGNTYFISDLHFGHKNILAYDNRPFRDIAENDEQLIERWNSVVTSDDDVWILGDISWYNAHKTAEIIEQLNGRKHLCRGNHDAGIASDSELASKFVEICDYKEICIGNATHIVISHYPIPCFKNHFYGWYHLYGHVHNGFEWNLMERVRFEIESLYDKKCKMYNVGCMMPYMDYTPRTLEEIVLMYEPSSNYVH